MGDESSRFTSDRRVREDASWGTQDDWESGVAENVDVTASGLVGQPSVQNSETPDKVVDSFEEEPDGVYQDDEDLSDYYTGDVSSYTFDDSETAPVEGSTRSLAGTDGSTDTTIYSYSGPQNHPERGNTFGVWMRSTGASTTYMEFAVQDSDTSYSVAIRWWTNEVRLSADTRESASSGADRDGTWWFIEVDWESDGTITARFWPETDDPETDDPETVLTATGEEYSSGGIGWRVHNNRSACWWDWSMLIE